MTEMRKDRRAPASLKVKYKSATVDEFIEQFGTDVSRGGIFIKTKKPLETGALLKFEFQLTDGSPVIQGVGRVAWKRVEQNARPDAPAGMGIKFIKLDDSVRTVVDRIAASHGPRPSRFDITEGAEHAPPLSSAPPPTTVSMPPSMRHSAPPPATGSVPPPAAALPPRVSSMPAPSSLRSPPVPRPFPSSTRPGAAPTSARPASPPSSARPAARSVSPAIANLFTDAPSPAPMPTPTPVPPKGGSAGAFKLPKGMAGTFFEDKAPAQVTTNARDTSEFLASAFSAGGAGHEVRAEARAQAERARKAQEPAGLADELFGDIGDNPALDAPLNPLGDPEELAGLGSIGRVSETKVPSFAELSTSEDIPSMEELQNEAPAAPDADGIDDDDDVDDLAEASLSGPPPAQLQLATPDAGATQAKASGGNAGMIIGLLVLVLGGAAGAYFFMQSSKPAEAPITEAPIAPVAPPTPAVAAEPLPTNAAPAQPTAAAPAQAAPAMPAEPPAVAAGPPVDVNITSLPASASVFVDGKASGATPTTLSLPSAKAVEISVRSPGYVTMKKSIEPSAGMEPVRFKLEELEHVIVINTEPPGATLSVRDLKVVSPAPLPMGHLEGTVTVSIEKEGFQRTSRIVRLEEFSERDGAMRAEISLSLTALPSVEKKPSSSRKKVVLGPPRPPEPTAPVLQLKPAEPKPKPEPEPKAEPKPEPKPKPAETALPDNPF